jgi:hypothetical protein
MDRAMAANAIAIVFVAVAIFANGRYCWKTLTHRIAPRLATWLIFFVASGLSLASYLAHADARTSFAANIGNRTDVVSLLVIIAAILFSARYEPERRRLKRFDWWCLAGAVLIVTLWVATGSSVSANLLLQVLMCVGYFPTLQHLFVEKRNTEPFDVWGVSLGLAALALIPSIIAWDALAIVYAGRATLSVMVTLAVMWHFHRREVFLNKPR